MKTLLAFVAEKYIDTITAIYGNEKMSTDVYLNPSISEIAKILRDELATNPTRSLRGFVFENGDLMVWSTNVLHFEIVDQLSDKKRFQHEQFFAAELHPVYVTTCSAYTINYSVSKQYLPITKYQYDNKNIKLNSFV